MRRIRPRSIYDVLALISFFLVIGGGTALASYVVSSNTQIGPNTVSGHKPPTGDHANIIAGSVNKTDIATGGVNAGNLGTGSVTSPKIATGAVTNPKLGFESVTNDKIGNQAIDDRTIHVGAVSTLDLADSSVNTQKLDNGAVTSDKIGLIPQARVEFTSSQTISNAIDTDLSFDVASYDNDSFFGLNHTHLTVPVDGVYAITANVYWEANSTETRFVGICKNDGGDCPFSGTVLASQFGLATPAAQGSMAQSVSTQAKLSAGDFVAVGVYQNSGGSLHVEPGSQTNLTMTWMGRG
jgi:hypothetical protein